MLFAIDLQNDYLDPRGKFYVPAAEGIKENIRQRLFHAVAEDELIAYTKNIYPDAEYLERPGDDIRWGEAIYPLYRELLAEAYLFEKSHYGIPPEEALRFRDKFQDRKSQFEAIEFVGVETNVCVLANVSIVQNVFPKSWLRIYSHRVAAQTPELHQNALEVLKGLKVEVFQDEL